LDRQARQGKQKIEMGTRSRGYFGEKLTITGCFIRVLLFLYELRNACTTNGAGVIIEIEIEKK
jgi:hypothetical protein